MTDWRKIPALQKSTMEVRFPQYCIYRTLSIITAVERRRLTPEQRKAMIHLWKLSFKESKFGGHSIPRTESLRSKMVEAHE